MREIAHEGRLVDPSTLTHDELRAALRWQEEHPSEAFALRQRAAAVRREEADRDALRSAWVMEGGDPEAFDEAHGVISSEARTERLKELDRAARDAQARSTWGGVLGCTR